MPLSSPDINGLEFDKSLITLLQEWLASYFDGASHQIYADTPFPLASTFPNAGYTDDKGKARSCIVAENMPMPQPLAEKANGFEIRIVPQSRMERQSHVEGGKLVSVLMSLHFWVTAKKPETWQSIELGREVADKLHALLGDPSSRLELALKGITHLQPSAPVASLSHDGDKRLVTCSADCQYIIPV